MDAFFSYVCEHADKAHWIIFFLILLSGLNIPISEDLLLLSGGAIAAGCIPEHTFRIYIWIYLGCILSAWETYLIGRLLGPKLYRYAFLKTILSQERLHVIRGFYAKYGSFTFVIGRFCPGGVRNALFVTSGFTKMPFAQFAFRDGSACLLSSSVFFYIGFHFGSHFDLLVNHFKRYSELFFLILGLMLIIIISVAIFRKFRDNER